MGRPRRTERPTTTRKIYFYRADAGTDDAGRPLPFHPRPFLEHIAMLPWTFEGNYWAGPGESVTCCWVDETSPPQRIRLGDSRRRNLPHVEEAGVLSDLPITPTSGIAEEIHMVFFPHNLVGAEFNFYGPRVSRFRRYLVEKAADVGSPPAFEPLLRQDIRDKLDRLEDIRLFQLRIRASYAETLQQADRDLASAFEAAASAGEADELEIVMKARPYSREPISRRLLETAKRLVARRDFREEAGRFLVKGLDGETGRVETIDVLSDKLISSQQIVRESERSRSLDSASAYAAIRRAHEELADDLRRAAGVDAEMNP